MSIKRKIKIAFYGPRGAGKTTVAKRLVSVAPELSIQVISSAKPAYLIQEAIYTVAGSSIPNEIQDEEILSGAASLIRKVNPAAFFEHVDNIINCSTASIVICPDSTLADRRYFSDAGFRFWYIWAPPEVRESRILERRDVARATKFLSPDVYRCSEDDFLISNDGTLEELDLVLADLIQRRLA